MASKRFPKAGIQRSKAAVSMMPKTGRFKLGK